MSKSKAPMNKENMTWHEWLAAAGYSKSDRMEHGTIERLRAAWNAGEDPTEHKGGRKGPCDGEHVSRIKCEKCGNEDVSVFRYVEAIECHRSVVGISAGSVQVESRYETGEGYDHGLEGSAYFECHGPDGHGSPCLHRMPIPEFVQKKIDWV